MKKSRAETQPQHALRIRKTPWHSLLSSLCRANRVKKSRVWQAIVPGTQNKPQDTLQIRTKQPPAVPLPGPNVAPEPNEKIKGLAGSCSGTQNKPRDTLQIRKTPWHGVTKQPPALNRMKKSRVWQAIVPGGQNKPQDTLQIKTPWQRDETASCRPSARAKRHS